MKETGVKVEEFENDEIEILRLMAGLEKLQTICFHHEYILLRINSHLDQVLWSIKKTQNKVAEKKTIL